MIKILLKDFSPEEFDTYTKLPHHWNFFKRVVLNVNSSWWKKVDREKVFSEAFNNSIESLRQEFGEDSRNWNWGHMHTLEFVHPLGRLKPFDKIFNIGPVEMSGSSQEVNNLKISGYNEGFKIKVGPSTRRIIDFGHAGVAFGILPTGNSGHLLSPFYKDQMHLYANGLYRNEWLNEEDINAHLSHQLILRPAVK